MTVESALSARRNAPHRITALASVVAAIVALAGCGPSLAPGTRECVGLPAEVCRGRVDDLNQEGMSHRGVSGYRLVCTSATCSAERGEGIETVLFGDGTHREGGFGYATPDDLPAATDGPLTVEPQCLGLPESWCEDFARSAAAEAGRAGGTVAAIAVACTSTCTETDGKGETRVTLSDSRELRFGWEYSSSPVSGRSPGP